MIHIHYYLSNNYHLFLFLKKKVLSFQGWGFLFWGCFFGFGVGVFLFGWVFLSFLLPKRPIQFCLGVLTSRKLCFSTACLC